MPMAALTTLIADAAAKFAAGDRAGSLAAYRDAVKIAPARAELWHNLGAVYAAQDARDEALAALAEAARLRPDWAEPWHARGHVLHAARGCGGAVLPVCTWRFGACRRGSGAHAVSRCVARVAARALPHVRPCRPRRVGGGRRRAPARAYDAAENRE